jgi:hypothetical protein
MNNTDFNEHDMALELSEYEYSQLTVPELLDKARKQLDREWLKMATEHPDSVREAYTNLMGAK